MSADIAVTNPESANPNGPIPEVESGGVLPCRLAGRIYGLDLGAVRTIQGCERLQINPAGESPAGWLLGDDELAVYDLGAELGLAHRAVGGRVVVMDFEGTRKGLLTDRVLQAVAIELDAVEPLPPLVGSASQRLVTGVAMTGEEPMILLRTDGILDAEDSPEPAEAQPGPSSTTTRAMSGSATGDERLMIFATSHGLAAERRYRFGLSLRQVVEITELGSLYPIPRAPGHLRGLVAWRDQPLVVFDLDRRLGLSGPYLGREERLLVARTANGHLLGLPTSQQIQVRSLPLTDHTPDTESRFTAPVLATYRSEESRLIIPDLDQLST